MDKPLGDVIDVELVNEIVKRCPTEVFPYDERGVVNDPKLVAYIDEQAKVVMGRALATGVELFARRLAFEQTQLRHEPEILRLSMFFELATCIVNYIVATCHKPGAYPGLHLKPGAKCGFHLPDLLHARPV